jgi:hypothetical protein
VSKKAGKVAYPKAGDVSEKGGEDGFLGGRAGFEADLLEPSTRAFPPFLDIVRGQASEDLVELFFDLPEHLDFKKWLVPTLTHMNRNKSINL